jgi:phage terminase large subunit-like protein
MVVPEGNGKTTLMGGLALYHADYTETASVLLGAASRDQCGLLLGQAAGFVYRTPGLHKTRFRVFEGYRRIDAIRSGGRIQVHAADDRTGDGVIPTLALLDELHRHRDMRLYRTWRGKLGKRNGKLVAISTAGEPGSEFEEAREAAKNAAEGVTVNGSHTRAASAEIVLNDWSVPAGESIEDMAAVKAANPFSGVTREQLATKRKSPTMTVAHWRRFVCNQATRSTESAITEQEWWGLDREEIPSGEPVWCGADFGWKWDTTALVPFWMPDMERRVIGDTISRILTPPRDGSSLPPEEVQQAFLDIHQRNPIHTVVMDENAGGHQIAGWLEDELGARVIAHSQAHSEMARAYEKWMEALRERWLRHGGDTELARHVLNAIAKVLPGGQTRFDRPSKSRSASARDQRVWDALTAASMVHAIAVDNQSPSVYEGRGLLSLS